MSIHSLSSEVWFKLDSPQRLYHTRHNHSLCFYNLLLGGVDPRFKVKNPVPTADVFTFDVKRNSWIKVMKLNTPRMYHSMCSVLGMVYVIGGQDGDNKWVSKNMPNMLLVTSK